MNGKIFKVILFEIIRVRNMKFATVLIFNMYMLTLKTVSKISKFKSVR